MLHIKAPIKDRFKNSIIRHGFYLCAFTALPFLCAVDLAYAGAQDLTAAAWTVDGTAAGGTNAAAGDNLTNTTNAAVTSVTISGTGYVENAAGAAIDAGNGSIGDITITGSGNGNVAVTGTTSGIYFSGVTGSATINNIGSTQTTIESTAASSSAISFATNDGSGLTINQGNIAGTTSGNIQSTGTGANSYGVYVSTTGATNTINNYKGSISAASAADGYAAIRINEIGNGDMSVVNGSANGAGTITGTNKSRAVHMESQGTGTFTLTNTQGTITSATTAANLATVRLRQLNAGAGGAVNVTNSGTISNTQTAGGGNAIYLNSTVSADALTLTNNTGGSITAATTGVAAIRIVNPRSASTITNSGTITGAGTTGAGGTAIAIDNSSNTTQTTFDLEDGSITNGALKLGTGAVSEDIVNLNGGALNGDIVSAGAGKGIVNVTDSYATNGRFGTTNALSAVNLTSGTLTLNNDVKATTTTLNAGTTLTVGTTGKTITGGLNNAGTLNIGANNLSVAGNMTGAGDLAVSLSSSGSGYIVNTTNTAGYTPGGTVTVTPTRTSLVTDGSKYAIIRGKAGNAPTLGTISAATEGLLSWTISDGTAYAATNDVNGHTIIAEDVVLVADIQAASSISGVSDNAAQSVDVLSSYSGSDTQLQDITTALQSLSSASEIDAAGSQLRTDDVNRGAVEGATNAVTGALNAVSTRSNLIRLANYGHTGMNAGDAMSAIDGLGVWGQGFGHYGDQDRKQGIDGYEAETVGLAIGADAQFSENIRAGVALSYALSDVDSKGSNAGNGIEIDSYQPTLYGSYTTEAYYVDASLAYSLHKYETHRQVDFGGFTDTVKGDHDGHQYTAKIDAGYPIDVGNDVTLTPTAGVSYSHLKQDSYTETSDNGAALRVGSQTSSSLKSSLGARVTKTFSTDNLRYTPEINAAWSHEFRDDPTRVTSSFAAGSGSFTSTSAKPASNALSIGLGLTLETENNLTFQVRYDAELKEDYAAHNALLEARLSF